MVGWEKDVTEWHNMWFIAAAAHHKCHSFILPPKMQDFLAGVCRRISEQALKCLSSSLSGTLLGCVTLGLGFYRILIKWHLASHLHSIINIKNYRVYWNLSNKLFVENVLCVGYFRNTLSTSKWKVVDIFLLKWYIFL